MVKQRARQYKVACLNALASLPAPPGPAQEQNGDDGAGSAEADEEPEDQADLPERIDLRHQDEPGPANVPTTPATSMVIEMATENAPGPSRNVWSSS